MVNMILRNKMISYWRARGKKSWGY